MSISDEEVATLIPGRFPLIENLAGGFEQCKQVLLQSPFHSLEEANYFFNKEAGVLHNMLQTLESIANTNAQTFILLQIIHQNATDTIAELIAKMASEGFRLNEAQQRSILGLHQLLHNITITDPFHFGRRAGSLVIHLEQNPGNIFSRSIDPVTDDRLTEVQAGLKKVVVHLSQNKLKHCISTEINGIERVFRELRGASSAVELTLITGFQQELRAINQTSTLDTQQQLMAIRYRLHRAVSSLSDTSPQFGLSPRSLEAIQTTLQQACDKLNQLIVPAQPLDAQHEQYMRFLISHDTADLPASADLRQELEPYKAKQLHIKAVVDCIDRALATAKASNGFNNSISRARYMVFETDIFSLDPLLSLQSSQHEAIYTLPDEHRVTTRTLNKYFRITPKNGAIYTKQGLEFLKTTAHQAGHMATDPITRTPLRYRKLKTRDIDCIEMNRLLNLQRLKNRPELCAQIKPELLRPDHLAQLALLPAKCFLNDSIKLLNLFNPTTMTDQQIEYVGTMVDEYSVFTTYRIIEHLNTHGIDWSHLCNIPNVCLDATIGSTDPVASLLQSLQTTKLAAAQSITRCQAHMNSWSTFFCGANPKIQQQLAKQQILHQQLDKIIPHLIPEPAANYRA
ncbi:MAG: hypothetical protein P1U40_07145 [Coxiellaceae bacterium]|nr:hypothetical protein [Coxiellaceae bacterium]